MIGYPQYLRDVDEVNCPRFLFISIQTIFINLKQTIMKKIKYLSILLLSVFALPIMVSCGGSDDDGNIPGNNDDNSPQTKQKWGENTYYDLDTTTGVLSITGTGPMTNYSISSYSSVPWFSQSEYIKTVYIADGITSIGDYVFYSCSNLQ